VDPTWQAWGAPETNSNAISFKPPFPAYPSGHATFGGAFFQVLRLYYKARDNLPFHDDEPDTIAFDIVSDELNGVSRDLASPYDATQPLTAQPGLIRTKVNRHFASLWEAMWENATSRVWLGVHWRFDAYAAKDVLVPSNDPNMPYQVDENGATKYKPVTSIRYNTTGTRADRAGQFPIGGVPLGIGIAKDIMQSKLKPTPANKQPTSA
jgi:vanadium chloroperoxidase